MFTIFKAILIVLTFFKYGVIGGIGRIVLSLVAIKVFIALFLGIIMPIVWCYISLRVSSYVMQYVLDYANTNIDLSDFPIVYQVSGVAAYLFNELGLSQALSLVTTAATIRFALSLSVFRRV